MLEIITALLIFLALQLLLVTLIVLAKKKLQPGGEVTILINEQKELRVKPGNRLLTTLANENIFISSACGGGGSCGQCRVIVKQGGGSILPTERGYISKREARNGMRLACQVQVKRDMKIEVPPEMLDIRKWECTVVSNENIATFIKELVLKLPDGEEMDFQPGGFVQVDIPPYALSFKSFDIDKKFLADWTKSYLFQYKSNLTVPITRAYSMANYPGEKGLLKLDVKIACPPEGCKLPLPPGKASSYIFNLKPGDKVTISGPYGDFCIHEGKQEMIYVGAGAGMAPLRSQILELMKGRHSSRKISYWYGSRTLLEVPYLEDFTALSQKYPNFTFHLCLSRPKKEDNWTGPVGHVHNVLYEEYLKNHEAPEDIQYYTCGPPMMTQSLVNMLTELGVEEDSIYKDDFGG
ncbi:MAG: NADH:ubiquinone reductase (Na(+)-transporting) subunit F [Candidatus Electrothrix sp. AX2]|nr:NADH:ubiquinone reductase (Na(+)-transporting) subunit F [Candidatus Electrothrix gigas]